MLTLETIYQAAFALKNVIRNTELIHAPQINPDVDVYIKPENLQVTGSFKVRGSAFKISQLSEEEKKKGVIACSAGNHAQGVALAATKQGIKSIICLPEGAPISKVEATKKYADKLSIDFANEFEKDARLSEDAKKQLFNVLSKIDFLNEKQDKVELPSNEFERI